LIITLPHNFEPRWYQRPAFEAFDKGYKRILLVHHRRAGKDKSCFNLMVRAAFERVGSYFYFLPTFAQARRVIWHGMDGAGFPFMSHIPQQLVARVNETDMRVHLKNGSIIQLVGSDNIDNIVGTNPIGCIFSEYSLEDPNGWNFIRPILRENKGWAVFNGTPRGKANHLYKLHEMARNNDDWFVQKLGVDDTGVMSEEDVNAERLAGMDEELIQQEFYCSFDGGMSGAYYISGMQDAERQGRITDVPHDPMLPVNTCFDLGISDSTAIIFFQQSPAGQIRILNYHEANGEGLQYYVSFLREIANEWGYNYGEHIAPHDIMVRELGTGKSRFEIARGMGLKFKPSRKLPFQDGINAVRMALPMCWFDREKTERLVEALMSYQKRWDKQQRCWRDQPLHNWASHGADAMRYLAVGRKNARIHQDSERYAPRYAEPADSHSWMAA